MYHMLDMEQRSYAIFSTILDSSFNGIVGRHLLDVLQGLDEISVEEVLSGKTKSYYTFLNISKEPLAIVEKERPGLKEIIKTAKLFAQSNSSILIEQASGVEAERLCEGIHNYSLRKGGPFILLNLAGMEQEDQHRLLFGGLDIGDSTKNPGALIKAKYGTLVLMGAG